jgi:hypothetical protein
MAQIRVHRESADPPAESLSASYPIHAHHALRAASARRHEKVGTSHPSQAVRAPNGRELLCLSGCTPHSCGGTAYAIVYDIGEQKVAFVKDGEADGQYSLYAELDPTMQAVLFDHAATVMNER